jgi:hypothetical protein
MWKEKWSPAVFYFSSNWKELSTLKLSLVQIQDKYPTAVQGTTVFYFMEDSTAYWIVLSGLSASPGLHQLIEAI